jgi:CRISPR-associated endonuclease/helicase Cas3
MLAYASPPPLGLLEAIKAAAVFHDLGKLSKKNQQALAKGRGHRLCVDHIDAGVAHLIKCGNQMAAWLVRAHHGPGLPSRAAEFAAVPGWSPLRGKRRRSKEPGFHDSLIRLVDANLPKYVERHRTDCGDLAVASADTAHGLAMRLALSCLVDADHEDSARHDTLRESAEPPPPRWAERIAALDRYVACLGGGDPDRDSDRHALYNACRSTDCTESIVSCQAAVGLGKTFAVTRYLLAQAQAAKPRLRRIFIVAPFTNIISQTVERLRKAIVLPGEDEAAVVAEHHHNADFGSLDLRELATLWRAPIVVTTAVQFFETLAGCHPGCLRKLHELPGSGVFVDEAHAAIPAHLWPQNWSWVRELAEKWSCQFVLASGSLVRFWEQEQVISPPCKLPELTPPYLMLRSIKSEQSRVRPDHLGDQALTRPQLVAFAVDHVERSGPVLVILNTVQSAAAVARDLAKSLDGLAPENHPARLPLHQRKVLHLSTAVCPRDRERILREINRRQDHHEGASDWVLVATSCVEAGVDLDFRTGFRERSSIASFIQTTGRVNRHGRRSNALLYDFTLDTMSDPLLTSHPGFKVSREVFKNLWDGVRRGDPPSELVTRAMIMEIANKGGLDEDLGKAEKCADYPEVARRGQVIDADTRTVVVDSRLLRLLKAYRRPKPRLLQRLSVQLWANKIERLALSPVYPGSEIYSWEGPYDPLFLGLMCGVLRTEEMMSGGGVI